MFNNISIVKPTRCTNVSNLFYFYCRMSFQNKKKINTLVHLVGFTIEIILRRTALWTSNMYNITRMHNSEKLLGRMNIWLRILKYSLQYNKKIGIQENIFSMSHVLW